MNGRINGTSKSSSNSETSSAKATGSPATTKIKKRVRDTGEWHT